MAEVGTWMWNTSAIHKRVHHVIDIYDSCHKFSHVWRRSVALVEDVAVLPPIANDETPTGADG